MENEYLSSTFESYEILRTAGDYDRMLGKGQPESS